jgi:hypothetical protein
MCSGISEDAHAVVGAVTMCISILADPLSSSDSSDHAVRTRNAQVPVGQITIRLPVRTRLSKE